MPKKIASSGYGSTASLLDPDFADDMQQKLSTLGAEAAAEFQRFSSGVWKLMLVITIFLFLTSVWMIASSSIVIQDTASGSVPNNFCIFTLIWGVLLLVISGVAAAGTSYAHYIAKFDLKKAMKKGSKTTIEEVTDEEDD